VAAALCSAAAYSRPWLLDAEMALAMAMACFSVPSMAELVSRRESVRLWPRHGTWAHNGEGRRGRRYGAAAESLPWYIGLCFCCT
jgi:hypothetical protein